jgi:hypothetical protein
MEPAPRVFYLESMLLLYVVDLQAVPSPAIVEDFLSLPLQDATPPGRSRDLRFPVPPDIASHCRTGVFGCEQDQLFEPVGPEGFFQPPMKRAVSFMFRTLLVSLQ